jgi:hypothetical protein
MKTQLQKTINKAARRSVEITVRGANKFTFSFEGKSEASEKAIANIFKGHKTTVDFDEELNETFIYVELAA